MTQHQRSNVLRASQNLPFQACCSKKTEVEADLASHNHMLSIPLIFFLHEIWRLDLSNAWVSKFTMFGVDMNKDCGMVEEIRFWRNFQASEGKGLVKGRIKQIECFKIFSPQRSYSLKNIMKTTTDIFRKNAPEELALTTK